MAKINEYEQALAGGSRENRFQLNFTLPGGVSGDVRILNIIAKSISVPGAVRGAIELKHSGKTARIAGDEMTNAEFPCTFSVPKDAKQVYKSMYDWFMLPDTSEDYKVTMFASQLDAQNNETQKWELQGVWVLNLPDVNFAIESTDTLKEFEVSFSIDRAIPL